jgi:hypothetical protein
MTEAEWLSCGDPKTMLAFLPIGASARKKRLFALACCARVWHLLTRKEVRAALEAAECCADGLIHPDELRPSWSAVRKALSSTPLRSYWEEALTAALHATTPGPVDAVSAAQAAARALSREYHGHYKADSPREWIERAYQCDLLRDLFVPFRAATAGSIRPTMPGGAAQKIVQAIYEGRLFEDLPILADALEEESYTDANLLAHLRGPDPHTRGCWAVDLLLAKP